MALNTQTELHLYDHPQSKIRFIEQVMRGREWEVNLHFPAYDPRSSSLGEVADTLKAKGYSVGHKKDDEGHQTLHIYAPSSKPSPVTHFRRFGLLKGTGYVISHPLGSMQSLLKGVGDTAGWAVDYFKDPAHANGALFITAESFLMSSGSGNNHGTILTPKNLLQSTAGGLFFSQSLVYLGIAEKGDDRIANALKRSIDKGRVNTEPAVGSPKPVTDFAAAGLGGSLIKTIKDHPIQTGAVLNDLGMLAYLGHAVMERKHHLEVLAKDAEGASWAAANFGHLSKEAKGALDAGKKALLTAHDYAHGKGFRADVAGALISIGAWTLLMLPSRHSEDAPKREGALGWVVDQFEHSPEKIASAMTVASSSFRLMGSISKANKLQMIGESIYIPGDLMLFFIKNKEYGISDSNKLDSLIEKSAAVIAATPMVFGETQRNQLLENSATYIATQQQALANLGKPIDPATVEQVKTKILPQLKEKAEPLLSEKYQRLTQAAATIAAHLPSDEARSVFYQGLSELDGVMADAACIKHCASQYALPPVEAFTSADAFAPMVASLVDSINPAKAAENASTIYDMLVTQLARKAPDSRISKPEMAERLQPDASRSIH